MGWPTPQEYNEAVQNPSSAFAEEELRLGAVEVNAMGLPRVTSGAFASVYRIRGSQGDVAVRCFLHRVSDQHHRYEQISHFVMNDQIPATVAFAYLPKGIRVHGEWYPIVKMEWVQGDSLDAYVRTHRFERDVMNRLQNNFREMVLMLEAAGIAHGDLQHGNIMVLGDGSLRLVDYDGMFVPSLRGHSASELGHRNYQHPLRQPGHFDSFLDNFSAWSIYSSLYCLSRDPTLFDIQMGDECLLFKQHDYRLPQQSQIFHILDQHVDESVRLAGLRLRALLARKMELIPGLAELEIDTSGAIPLESLSFSLSTNTSLPDWISEDLLKAEVSVMEQAAPIARKPPETPIPVPSNVIPLRAATSFWPNAQHFMTMIASPSLYFVPPELQNALLFRPMGGTFECYQSDHAIVFHMVASRREVAVKVFLHDHPDRAERFRALKDFVTEARKKSLPVADYFVDFEYIEHGLQFMGAHFPIVVMDWVDGEKLGNLIGNDQRVSECADVLPKFRRMMATLYESYVTHGDISPDNVLISQGRLKLVDYDTIQTPKTTVPFVHQKPRLLAHRKSGSKVSPYDDQYAGWIIDTAMYFTTSNQPAVSKIVDLRSLMEKKILVDLLTVAYGSCHRRTQLLYALSEMEPSSVPPLNRDASIKWHLAAEYGLDFPKFSETHVCPDLENSLTVRERANAVIKSVGTADKVKYLATSASLVVTVFLAYILHSWIVLLAGLGVLLIHEVTNHKNRP